MKKQAAELITALEQGGFVATCPNCVEQFKLRDASLFHMDDFTPEAEEKYRQMLAEQKERRRALQDLKRKIPERSEAAAVSVNIGKTLEKIAPVLPTFVFDKNDSRAMFDPIDFVIFDGLAAKGEVSRIIFVDIKTGRASLTNRQRKIVRQIEDKNVEFIAYSKGDEK